MRACLFGVTFRNRPSPAPNRAKKRNSSAAALDLVQIDVEARGVWAQGDSLVELRGWVLDQVENGQPLESVLTDLMLSLEQRLVAARALPEEKLRRNEELMRLGLSASSMGTWDWQIERDYVSWSAGVEPLFGLAEGALGHTFAHYLSMVSTDDQGRVKAAIDEALWGTVRDYAVEHRVTWPDGSLHWLECRGRVYLHADGTPLRMIGTVAEVSHRKRAEASLREREEQLRQAQKMEAISRLAGGVAHDFNNLLTTIGGYSSLALLEFSGDDPCREYLEEIQRAGERGASLTKQLSTLGRKRVLAPRLLDLNALLDDLQGLLRRVVGEDVEVVWNRASAPAVIHADAGQIEQLLVNLAANARDAMSQGGTLSITSSSVDIGVDDPRAPQGRYALLSVLDTGHGMDDETMARMFEPFFSTKDPGRGTGLGLSTAYGIVQQLSGSIRARSALGEGTEFEVYLPERERGALSAHPESLAPLVRSGTETVLLVEDESQVRKLVCDVLRARGYTVLAAKDGLEAIPLEENYPGRIDLLITDLVMPGISGRDLAQHVSSARPETRVLFISGYSDDVLLRQGVNTPLSRQSFLQKPFALEDLLLRVRTVLDAPAPRASAVPRV